MDSVTASLSHISRRNKQPTRHRRKRFSARIVYESRKAETISDGAARWHLKKYCAKINGSCFYQQCCSSCTVERAEAARTSSMCVLLSQRSITIWIDLLIISLINVCLYMRYVPVCPLNVVTRLQLSCSSFRIVTWPDWSPTKACLVSTSNLGWD